MELRHLKYFVAVAEELHFARAAEKLHIVQSALSRQIQDLEYHLKIKLFIRDSRNVRLTEAGLLFLEEAKAILNKSEKAVQLVRTLGQGYSGRLRIGFVGMAGISGVLQEFLTFFRTCCPQLLIELVESESHIQIQRLKEGEIDVAIVSFPEGENEMLESFTLMTSRWMIGMSTGNPLSQQQGLCPTQLKHENFILYGSQQTEYTQIALIESLIGSTPNITHCANSTISTLTLIAAGYGIALLPESLCHIGVPGVVYKPLNLLTSMVDIRVFILRFNMSPQVKNFVSAMKRFRKTTYQGRSVRPNNL